MQSRKRDHAHIQTLISFIHWNQEDEEAVELCDIFFSFYQTIYVRDKKNEKLITLDVVSFYQLKSKRETN